MVERGGGEEAEGANKQRGKPWREEEEREKGGGEIKAPPSPSNSLGRLPLEEDGERREKRRRLGWCAFSSLEELFFSLGLSESETTTPGGEDGAKNK